MVLLWFLGVFPPHLVIQVDVRPLGVTVSERLVLRAGQSGDRDRGCGRSRGRVVEQPAGGQGRHWELAGGQAREAAAAPQRQP